MADEIRLEDLLRRLDSLTSLVVRHDSETTVEGATTRYVITRKERIELTIEQDPSSGVASSSPSSLSAAAEASTSAGAGADREWSSAEHVRLLELPVGEYQRRLEELRAGSRAGHDLPNLLTDPMSYQDNLIAGLRGFESLARAVSGFLYIARHGRGLGRIDVMKSNEEVWLRPYDAEQDYDDYRSELEELLRPILSTESASSNHLMQIFKIDQHFRTLVPATFADGDMGGLVRGPMAGSAWWQLTDKSLEAIRAAAPKGANIVVPEPWQDWLNASQRTTLREAYVQAAPSDANRAGKRIVWPICVRLETGTTSLPARVVTHPPAV